MEMKKPRQYGVNILSIGGAVCAMLCLIFAPGEAIESARFALSLCAELIVPSLLPFFTVSALMIRLGVPARLGQLLSPLAGRLWGVSGAGATAFLAGICGGYPLGAQTIGEMYSEGLLSRDESERLLGFCNNSGPSFLIGVIGSGVFSSRRAGLLLYASHVLAAVLTGILFRRSGNAVSSPPQEDAAPFSSALVAAVRQSVSAVLSVCGFVICFCVLSGLLETLGVYRAASAALSTAAVDESVLHAFLVGILELGSGVGQLRGIDPSLATFTLSAFLSGWGGLSVHFQTAAVLNETDLSLHWHRFGRLISGVLSALLAVAAGQFFYFA